MGCDGNGTGDGVDGTDEADGEEKDEKGKTEDTSKGKDSTPDGGDVEDQVDFPQVQL